MTSVANLAVQPTSDPNTKVFHTRIELTDKQHEIGVRGNVDELGEFGRLVISIVGIEQVRVLPYVVMVTKAPLYEWSEVEPEILNLLRQLIMSQKLLEEDYASALEDQRGQPPAKRPRKRISDKS